MPANPEKLKIVKEFSHKNIFLAIARTPAGRTLVGSSDGKVSEIDLSAAKPELTEIGGHDSYVTGLAMAGNLLVSGGYDGKLNWWDIEKKTRVRSVDAHRKWIRDVRASRDGKYVVSVADDMVARVWDAAGGKLMFELRDHKEITPHHFPSMLYACAITRDGKVIATGDKVGHIALWDARTGAKFTELEAPGMYTWDPVQRRHSIGGIRSLAFSPDGAWLAVGGIGKVSNIDHLDGKARVEVFDWKTGKKPCEFPGDKFSGLVNQLEFHPKGDWLLGAGGANDGFLLFFDTKAKKTLKQEKAAMHIHRFALDDEAESLVVAGHGKIVQFSLKA
jgi:WD40 repeat protein